MKKHNLAKAVLIGGLALVALPIEISCNAATRETSSQNISSSQTAKTPALLYSGPLTTETSGLYIYRPILNKYEGGAETSYTFSCYDSRFGKLSDAKEDRLVEICEDQSTSIYYVSKPSIRIPGQYFAVELVSSFDYNVAVSQLELQENFSRQNETLAKDSELLDVHLKKMELLYAGGKDLSDTKIRQGVVKNIIAGGSFMNVYFPSIQRRLYNNQNVRKRAEEFLNLYILRKSYDANIDMSKIKSDQVELLPELNRILYVLSRNYHGSIYLPKEENLYARPFSVGGFNYIKFYKDGILIDGEEIKGIKKETADALRHMVAKRIICFESMKKEREEQIKKWGDKINKAGFPFDIDDFQKTRVKTNVLTENVIDAKEAKKEFIESVKDEIRPYENKYRYYQKIKKLP